MNIMYLCFMFVLFLSGCSSIIPIEKQVQMYGDGTTKHQSDSYIDSSGKRIQHGKEINYYPNGNIQSTCIFQHGQRHGKYFDFWENGKRAGAWKYSRGGKTGVAKTWHQNGKIASKSTYENGKLNGQVIFYNTNGLPIAKYMYSNGTKLEKGSH